MPTPALSLLSAEAGHHLQRGLHLLAWRFRHIKTEDCEILYPLQYSDREVAVTDPDAFRDHGGCRIGNKRVPNCCRRWSQFTISLQ